MSSQGTGEAVGPLSFEEELLKSWGLWARAGGVCLTHAALKLMTEEEVPLFSDDDMMEVDKTVAGLPPYYKRFLVRIFIRREPIFDERNYQNAVDEFSSRFMGNPV